MQQKIVLIGGPGTGKSSVLNELIKRNYYCIPEVSREVTLEAQKKGIAQLFLVNPLLFSEILLEKRKQQFLEAQNSNKKFIFFDRGIPDIHAYLDFVKLEYPEMYLKSSREYQYDRVFLFPPWKEIHIIDNERYEDFTTTKQLHKYLINSYKRIGYKICIVPFGRVTERTNFILNSL